jgi:hypothetical protein
MMDDDRLDAEAVMYLISAQAIALAAPESPK